MEGNNGTTEVPVCVRLDSDNTLDRDVDLVLNTDDITASKFKINVEILLCSECNRYHHQFQHQV